MADTERSHPKPSRWRSADIPRTTPGSSSRRSAPASPPTGLPKKYHSSSTRLVRWCGSARTTSRTPAAGAARRSARLARPGGRAGQLLGGGSGSATPWTRCSTCRRPARPPVTRSGICTCAWRAAEFPHRHVPHVANPASPDRRAAAAEAAAGSSARAPRPAPRRPAYCARPCPKGPVGVAVLGQGDEDVARLGAGALVHQLGDPAVHRALRSRVAPGAQGDRDEDGRVVPSGRPGSRRGARLPVTPSWPVST